MTVPSRPLALVTGASAGIGVAYAERLAHDGWDLIVTGRRGNRLEELSQRLHSDYGATTETLVADLNTEQGLQDVDTLCRERELQMLVNNAGLAHYMPLLDLPEEQLRELINVDVLAPTLHSQTAARGMVERGRGAIITVSSLLALSDALALPTFPPRVVYASSKSYVVMFSRLLAEELRDTGVKVQVVLPGIVRSEFHSRQNMDMTNRPRMEPVDIVQASFSALDQDEVVCIPSLEDPALITARDEAQAAVVQTAFPPQLAKRYT